MDQPVRARTGAPWGACAALALLAAAVAAAPELAAQTPIRVPSGDLGTPLLPRLRSLLGLAALVGAAWAMSSDRRRIPWRIIGWGLGLQVAFAIVILRTDLGVLAFDAANRARLQRGRRALPLRRPDRIDRPGGAR